MKEMFWEMIKVLGTPNFSDLIPIFKPFDPQGLKRKVTKIFDQLDAFYEKLIEERLAEKAKVQLETAKNEKRDMLDVLLSYKSNDKKKWFGSILKSYHQGNAFCKYLQHCIFPFKKPVY